MNLRALFLLLLLAPAPAAAGVETPSAGDGGAVVRELRASEVRAAEIKTGDQVRVSGKYEERIDNQLTLIECEVPFLLPATPLAPMLRDLTARKDNLTLTGVVVMEPGGDLAIKVTAIERAPSDLDAFTSEAERLLEPAGALEPAARAERLLALARRIFLHQREFEEEELEPLVQRTLEASYAAYGEASAEEPGPQLRLALELRSLGVSREATLPFALDLGRRFPRHPEVEKLLLELGCRRYRGRWVPYEEFKQLEGFVLHEGRWLTSAEKHLADATRTLLADGKANLLLLRQRTERQYEFLAREGRTETGMTREEVQAALGFPDRVRRTRLLGGELDQWDYDGAYYYFLSGTLVLAPEG